MRNLTRFTMASAAVAGTPIAVRAQAGEAVAPDVSRYESVLQKYVGADGKVDYAGLKADGAALNGFVSQLAAVSPESAPRLFPARDAQLAYWINAYNALVLHSFSADYPEKRDRLTGLVGRASFFYRKKHKVGGRSRSLGDMEDNTIRKVFGEPRIHFALVCASGSCPWLSRTAYTAANLEERLEAETRLYFSQGRNFRMDESKREVTLPQIFEWFAGDFGGTPEKVLAFVARYRKDESAKFLKGTWRIRYLDYDWSPNDRR